MAVKPAVAIAPPPTASLPGAQPDAYAQRVCVIGAGPAGLATARALAAARIPFDVLERHSDVGGIWDIENRGTPIYETAHLISSKRLSGFEGFAFPDAVPEYPSHAEVLAFLRSFARHFDLRRHVQFSTEVRRAERDARGWRVTLESGETRLYRALLLATGFQWLPHLPSYPGMSSFRGQSFHSAAYKTRAIFHGKRVLIVGCGASAVDIANDAAAHAQSACLSMRRGHYIVPKHMFGVPTDVWAKDGPTLPAPLRQWLLGKLLTWLHGDPANYGLPKPDHRVLERPPILSDHLLAHLSHGRVRPKPDVRSIEPDGAIFVDGSFEPFDLIVYCTGYEERWPVVAPSELDDRGENDLYLHMFHRRYDDLFVLGLLRSNGGGFSIFERQARVVARALTASHPQRRALAKLKAAPNPELGKVRYLRNDYQSPYVDVATYVRELAALERRVGWRRG